MENGNRHRIFGKFYFPGKAEKIAGNLKKKKPGSLSLPRRLSRILKWKGGGSGENCMGGRGCLYRRESKGLGLGRWDPPFDMGLDQWISFTLTFFFLRGSTGFLVRYRFLFDDYLWEGLSWPHIGDSVELPRGYLGVAWDPLFGEERLPRILLVPQLVLWRENGMGFKISPREGEECGTFSRKVARSFLRRRVLGPFFPMDG